MYVLMSNSQNRQTTAWNAWCDAPRGVPSPLGSVASIFILFKGAFILGFLGTHYIRLKNPFNRQNTQKLIFYSPLSPNSLNGFKSSRKESTSSFSNFFFLNVCNTILSHVILIPFLWFWTILMKILGLG